MGRITKTEKYCYKCYQEPKLGENLHFFFETTGKLMFMCEDCSDGSTTFTCELCCDGLASQQVDYYKYGYREWWCTSCCEDSDETTRVSKGVWLYTVKE